MEGICSTPLDRCCLVEIGDEKWCVEILCGFIRDLYPNFRLEGDDTEIETIHVLHSHDWCYVKF